MNSVNLIGSITSQGVKPYLSKNGKAFFKFNLKVPEKRGEQWENHFFTILCFNEFAKDYKPKDSVAVYGRITTNTKDSGDGKKITYTSIVADRTYKLAAKGKPDQAADDVSFGEGVEY